jgi:hypothetical protein
MQDNQVSKETAASKKTVSVIATSAAENGWTCTFFRYDHITGTEEPFAYFHQCSTALWSFAS